MLNQIWCDIQGLQQEMNVEAPIRFEYLNVESSSWFGMCP